MARRLTNYSLALGIVLATVVDSTTTFAQNTPPTNSANSSDPTQQKGPDGKEAPNPRRGRGEGRSPEGFAETLKRNPDLYLEIVKRDGGALELLSPLMKPEVRQELKLTDERAAAVEKFFADLKQHYSDDFESHKNQPDVNWEALFDQRLKSENKRFRDFLSQELTPAQFDRLIGIFVQYRNLRALGNQIVAVEKLGLTPEGAKQLRSEIDSIRSKVRREHNERARQMFENGNNVQFAEQVNKSRRETDARIEKLPMLKKEHFDKLNALRGKELPSTLLDSLDRPPRPPQKKDGP